MELKANGHFSSSIWHLMVILIIYNPIIRVGFIFVRANNELDSHVVLFVVDPCFQSLFCFIFYCSSFQK